MRDASESHPSHRPESSSIYAALAAQARRTSDGALATSALVGVIAVIGLAFGRPGWWALALPLVSLGAFGVWGILERERTARGAEQQQQPSAAATRALAVGQWLAAAVGTVATIVAAFALLGVLFGTVIS
ncbi:MAG TPA: hypothetical protein VFJ74_17995 [Gemmatimonadaceae bacterium]|nr:hypothetical protein [Gemmatimonadaceae bacterium]